MRFRRGIVSYILWALYGLTVCAALTLQIRTISLTFLREETLWYLPAAAGCVLFLFAGCFLPIRLICRKAEEKTAGKRKAGRAGKRRQRKICEALYVFALFVLSLALRLGSMEETFSAVSGSVQGQAVSAVFPFASLTWTTLEAWLGILLSGLPGGAAAAELVRCLYETAGIILFYPALRILAGKIQAAAVTAALAVLPVFPVSTGGGGLFLPAAAVLLLSAAFYLKKMSCGKGIPAEWAVLCGLPAGAAFFLDPFFSPFLLLPVWASAFVCGAGRAGRRAAGMALVCVSACAGFFSLAAAACFFPAENPAVLTAWLYAAVRGLSADAFLSSLTGTPDPVLFLLCCLCVFYIFGFFDQKGNAGSIWIPAFLLSLFFSQDKGCAGMPALLFWLILAGMGIHSACVPGRRKEVSGRPAGEAERLPDGTKQPDPQPDPLPGSPLPNPLPVPRRHARGQMEYAYEPGEEEMFFDIDQLKEGDDFDLS